MLGRGDHRSCSDARLGDVLTLNLGGEKTLQTQRSTLTHCTGSKLADMFSGRWDDVLPRDADNNFFIDYEPELFCPLLKYLRVLSSMTLLEYDTLPPISPTFQDDPLREIAFRRMVDSYHLTNVLYNYEVYEYGRNLHVWSNRRHVSKNHTIFETELHNENVRAKYFCLDRPMRKIGDCHSRKVQAFEVTLNQNTDASVGWIRRCQVLCNDAQSLRRQSRPVIFSSSDGQLHCASSTGSVVSHVCNHVEFKDYSVVRCQKHLETGELEWFVDGKLVVSTCRALPFGQASLEDTDEHRNQLVGWSSMEDTEMIPYILLAAGSCRFSGIELET